MNVEGSGTVLLLVLPLDKPLDKITVLKRTPLGNFVQRSLIIPIRFPPRDVPRGKPRGFSVLRRPLL